MIVCLHIQAQKISQSANDNWKWCVSANKTERVCVTEEICAKIRRAQDEPYVNLSIKVNNFYRHLYFKTTPSIFTYFARPRTYVLIKLRLL